MEPNESPKASRRLVAIDAFRGFVMLLMMAEVLHLAAVAAKKPDSAIWKFLAHHQTHVEWVGCSLHDLIQPSFSFLVGAAMVFSLASRSARGQSKGWMILHALWRALVLVFLGIFLRSIGKKQTYYTFEDTLTQIGLGYPFLFLLGLRPRRDQWIALVVLLVGYWAAFALYPAPGTDFDFEAVGVKAEWRAEHAPTGFAAHWDKNSNLAWAFDRWFLNLFPRQKEFWSNGGGYATLSFIPTLATMVLGLLAGGVLRSERSDRDKLAWLVLAGAIGLLSGWALGASGICPVVKRIWTPSWVLFSGGWCFLILAAFYAATDFLGWKGWAFALVVVGMNSIAAYMIAHLFDRFIGDGLRTHLGEETFRRFGPEYEPFVHGAGVLLVMWLILFWMYRRKILLKI
jgi:heparan-alpha-glucosaminide N-acetyltransferase